MNKEDIQLSISDDYAVLDLKNFSFYYGYEYGRDLTDNEVWGFYLEDNKRVRLFQITLDEMKKIKNCPDQWNCKSMLIFGIGLYLNKIGGRNE